MNIENITLEETKLYSSYYSFWKNFKLNGITTVGQVLDSDVINKITKNMKWSTIDELNGFINLLKCKYLNIPIPNIDELNKTAQKKAAGKSYNKIYKYKDENGFEYSYDVDYKKLGICIDYMNKIERSIILPKKDIIQGIPFYKILEEYVNINPSKTGLKETLNTILYSYYLSNEFKNMEKKADIDEMTRLIEQLEYLTNIRNNISFQIDNIQKRINELNENKRIIN